MDKKKAIVCTILFSVVVFGAFISTFLITSKYGFSVFNIIAPWICGDWVVKKVETFYKWLVAK